MIVYDNRAETRNGRDAWRETQAQIERLAAAAQPSHDDVVAALIAFGVYESAVADALCPLRDEPHPLLARMRTVAESLGQAVVSSMSNDRGGIARAAARAAHAGAGCADIDVPRVSLRVPEGYAYYSLYPESYAEVAMDWAAHERPDRVLALGLRSIGTSLSAVVAGALRRCGVDTTSWTLRPRGHPFDRRVDIADTLAATLQAHAGTVLIVDEGPGLSGSSFAAAAAAMAAHGVPDARIIFVPSWNPDPSTFVSAAASTEWRRHRALVPSFDRTRRALRDVGVVPDAAREISSGTWRDALSLPRPWPAVHPQHERRKFLLDGRVARFAGLGAYGNAALRRATALADAGWSAGAVGIRRGFLTTTFVRGTPMRQPAESAAFIAHAASYLAWLRLNARSGGESAAPIEPLATMLLTNVREALGAESLAAAETLVAQASSFSEPAVAIDGRLQPHEWLELPNGGWIKTDALDHHRDHFLPGCTDAAWDVAGFIVEWDLASGGQSAFVDEYASRSGDREIGRRLPFFMAAYAAFRAGYCAMAATTLAASEDGARFEVLANRYRDALRVTLRSAQPAVPSAR